MTNRYMKRCSTNQGNANKNAKELSSHTCQNGYCPKDEISVGEDVEKRTLCTAGSVGEDVEKRTLCTAGGNVNWYNHCGK